MAMIRDNGGGAAKGAIPLDLGDLSRQGEAIKEAARAHAEAVIRAAREERDRLLKIGRESGVAQGLIEGREQGRQEGLAAGKAEALAAAVARLSSLEAAWTAALQSFAQERESFLQSARADVVELAVLLAEKIAKRAIDVDPRSVEPQMEAVLALLARPTAVRVSVHPEDDPVAREALPGLMARFPMAEHVTIVADPTLAPGSVVARTAGGGEIDASIRAQLDRVARELVPEREAPEARKGRAA